MTRLRLADVMAERLAEAHDAVDTPDEEQGTGQLVLLVCGRTECHTDVV